MPRLIRTIPIMSRISQRLTWRPGVNQRASRGFIRRGAKSAQSLAQLFLNSFGAHFVTSFGPFPFHSNRAYNPDRTSGDTGDPVHGACSIGTKEVVSEW